MHHQSACDTGLSPGLRTECLGLSWALWTSREQPWGPWGSVGNSPGIPRAVWTSHSTDFGYAVPQIQPKVLWLFPCLCQLVGAGYHYCIIIPKRHGIYCRHILYPHKGSPFGGENSDTSICISISLWLCLPLHLSSVPCLCLPRSSQQSRQLGGNDPISRATGMGLSPECP